MTGTEIDIGAILAAAIAVATGLGYYLRASGKWREFVTKRAERQEAAAEEARVNEMARTGVLQARVDELVDSALADLRARVSRLEAENESLEKEVGVLRDENYKYRTSVGAMEEALNQAHHDRAEESARWRETQENLESDIKTMREVISSQGQRIESLEGELERKTTELNAVKLDQRNYKAALKDMELDKVKLAATNDELRAQNVNLTALVEKMLAAIKPPEPRTLGAA